MDQAHGPRHAAHLEALGRLHLTCECTMRVTLRGVVLAAFFAASANTVDAQLQVARWSRTPALGPSPAPSLSSAAAVHQSQPASRSTFAERLVGGVVVGGLASLAVSAWADNEDGTLLAYTAGSAGGVLLATVARERPRPVPVLLGTAVGALPLLALATSRGDHPLAGAIFLVGGVTTSLLGASGQRW
jgi:hypothetical protein